MDYAEQEARRLASDSVHPEHILLGLLQEKDNLASAMLVRQGVDLTAAHSEAERRAPSGNNLAGERLLLSRRGERSLRLAYSEASLLRNDYLGPEHLLLGLIREEQGLTNGFWSRFGVDYDQALSLLPRPTVALDDVWPPPPQVRGCL